MGFDFRDMLGGAEAKVADLGTDQSAAIGEIGFALFHPIAEQCRLHRCSPADALAAAMTHIAVCYTKGGEPDVAIAALGHIAKIAGSVSRAIGEHEAGRG